MSDSVRSAAMVADEMSTATVVGGGRFPVRIGLDEPIPITSRSVITNLAVEDGKVYGIVYTGQHDGIGQYTTRLLAEEGGKVVLRGGGSSVSVEDVKRIVTEAIAGYDAARHRGC